MDKTQVNQLSNLLEVMPPNNQEAEMVLLGALLLDNKQIKKVKNIVSPNDFYDDRNKMLYQACLYMDEEGLPIDIITLSDFLSGSNSLSYVGGVTYLTEVISVGVNARNVDGYARIIKQKSVLRGIILLGGKLNREGRKDTDVSELLGEVQKGLDSLAAEYAKIYSSDEGSDRLYQYHELVGRTKEFIDKSKVPTLFKKVDEILDGGFQGGELAILSGPTKMGKSSIIQTWSYLQAKNGIPSVWFSFEMSWQELTKKFMGMDTEGEIDGEPTKLPLYYPIENKNLSLEWLEQKIKHGITKYGAKIVYIDHLHFLLSLKDSSSVNVSFLLGGIIRELKRIAVRNDVPIILVAHIKKIDSESEPRLSDIRDSSFVSQESDFSFLIWRERIKKSNGKYSVETINQDEIYTNMATLALEANRRNGITKRIKIGMVNGRFYEEEEFNQLTLGNSIPSNSYEESNQK